MATVVITPEAQAEFSELPLPIQARVLAVFKRPENRPHVGGAKPLRKNLAGSWRIRTGDDRVVFRSAASGDSVTVWKIGYRGDV